ncbi:hypothetical protein DFJ58DRAFT_837782 [Suillus subalutaceus]|uniref:uncharacterized protein n=1 Tax=Suillus subalutaceus TaxID=48586 RepID=UPI001B867E7B|nr:uncharacterized protein DFJ58DRAFT_837782 [Suillus subalutaceus]KAG1868944.1 hypothetical protein DFJ58DRAFT_837782 [Suillus subalutaceus]
MPCKSKRQLIVNNTFKLDTHPVQATSVNDEQTRKKHELDVAVGKARIGVSRINILEIANELRFGTYNDRPQNSSEVNKMITLFEKHGWQWYKESNALAIVIEPSHLCPGQKLDGNWSEPESLEEVKFVDRKPLILAYGQYHVAALKKMAQTLINEEAMLEKWMARIKAMKDPSNDSVAEHKERRTCLAAVKGELQDLGNWAVVLYDKVARLHIQNWIWMRKDIQPQMWRRWVIYDADNLLDVIDGGKAGLGSHLSQNQILHIYAEMQEEELVLKLRDFYDVYLEEGEEAALELI